jgi:hypothetical protein
VVYVYNPTNAPQIVGQFHFKPRNYTAVTEETAQILRGIVSTPLLIEGDPRFPAQWVRYVPQGFQEPSSL